MELPNNRMAAPMRFRIVLVNYDETIMGVAVGGLLGYAAFTGSPPYDRLRLIFVVLYSHVNMFATGRGRGLSINTDTFPEISRRYTSCWYVEVGPKSWLFCGMMNDDSDGASSLRVMGRTLAANFVS